MTSWSTSISYYLWHHSALLWIIVHDVIIIFRRGRARSDTKAARLNRQKGSNAEMPVIHSDTDTDTDNRRFGSRSLDRSRLKRNESNSSADYVSRNNSQRSVPGRVQMVLILIIKNWSNQDHFVIIWLWKWSWLLILILKVILIWSWSQKTNIKLIMIWSWFLWLFDFSEKFRMIMIWSWSSKWEIIWTWCQVVVSWIGGLGLVEHSTSRRRRAQRGHGRRYVVRPHETERDTHAKCRQNRNEGKKILRNYTHRSKSP